MNWKPFQSIAKGISLTDLLRPEFVEYLDEHFPEKRVESINLQIRVRDEKISDYTENEIVFIAHRNGVDTILKKLLVDADNTKTLDIFTDAIDKIKESE